MDATGAFQNDVEELETLAETRYENIFRMFIKNEKYFFNILKKVDLDLRDADPSTYETIKTKSDAPWTSISNQIYGTMDLWWLIYTINQDKVNNPVELVPGGTQLVVITPLYVRNVLDQISTDLNPTSS